jgi:hypothetical protein
MRLGNRPNTVLSAGALLLLAALQRAHATQPVYASPSGTVPEGGASTAQITYQFSGVTSSTVVNALINRYLNAYQACYIAYSIPASTLYLVGDNGTLYPAPAQKAECGIALVSAQRNGSTLNLIVSYTFYSPFVTETRRGDTVIWGGASDSGGWSILGTWRVWAPPNPPPTPYVQSIQTSNTVQSHQLLTGRYNAAGASSTAQILVNRTSSIYGPDGSYACYLQYDGGSRLYLVADNGSTLLGYYDFTTGTLNGTHSNSQCTLNTPTRTPYANYLTITADVTFAPSYATGTKVVHGGVQAGGLNSEWQPQTMLFGASGPGIAGPSVLHTNLGAVPFDTYDDDHDPTGPLATICPQGTTVRGCYRSILADFHNQGVTGVRFFVGFCGGGGSTPLSGCSSFPSCSPPTVSGPGSAWLTHLQNFYSDVYNAKIYGVGPTMAFGDFNGVGRSCPPSAPPSGSICKPLNSVWYTPTEPWANESPGIAVDDQINGYNCSPKNPLFVGWANIYSVMQNVIQYAAAANLNLFEFDIENELNMVSFPVQARLIYDNVPEDVQDSNYITAVQLSELTVDGRVGRGCR